MRSSRPVYRDTTFPDAIRHAPVDAMTGAVRMTDATKAFSREAGAGSREENASECEVATPFRFYSNGNDASLMFRRLMGRFATGVAVVLTAGEQGPIGLTVNSFTSLSLDPPLLLFCARNESRAGRAAIACGSFSVNILSDAQRHISGYFAGRTEGWDIDACGRHRHWFTIPDCNAAMFCEVANTYPGGDHTIIVGAVREIVGPPTAKQPLLYHEGRYSALPLRAVGTV
mgnify:FL=1